MKRAILPRPETHAAWQFSVAILLVLLLAFALRFYGLGAKALWGDEIAQAVWSSWDWARLWQEFRAPPDFILTFALVHLTQGIGTSEFFVRLPSALTSLLCVPLMYVVARRLSDKTTAFVAMILMAVAPYQVWYAQDARMYAALGCWGLLSFYFFLRLIKEHTDYVWRVWACVGLTVGNTFALYTHLFGVFPILSQAVIAVGLVGAMWARTRQVSFPRWTLFLAVSFIATVILALPLASGTLPYVLQGAQPAVSETIAPAVRFQFTFSFLWELLGNFGLGAGDYWRTLVSLAGAVLGLAIMLLKRPRAAWMSMVWFALPLLLLAIAQPKHTVAARYLIFLQPIYLVLTSYAVVQITRSIVAQVHSRVPTVSLFRVAGLLGIVLLALFVVAPLTALYARAKLNDWRAIANYLEQHAEAGDLIFGEKNTPNMNALAYYLPNLTRFNTPPTTLETMQTALQAERRIWYVSVGDYFDKEGDRWARQMLTPIPASDWREPNLVYEPTDDFVFTQSESPATIYLHNGKFPSEILYAGKQGFANDGPAQIRLNPQDLLEAKLALATQSTRVLELEFASKTPAQFDVMVNGKPIAQVREKQAPKGARTMQWVLSETSDAVLIQVQNQSGENPLFVRRISLMTN